jgi:hypothetical protein
MTDTKRRKRRQRRIVPTFEHEVLKAKMSGRRAHNAEKASTTAIGVLEVLGVEISSRYGKVDEMAVMVRVVEELPKYFRNHVQLIWCDSQPCHLYVVTLHETAAEPDIRWILCQCLGEDVHNIITRHNQGCNGLIVECGDERREWDPWGPDDGFFDDMPAELRDL